MDKHNNGDDEVKIGLPKQVDTENGATGGGATGGGSAAAEKLQKGLSKILQEKFNLTRIEADEQAKVALKQRSETLDRQLGPALEAAHETFLAIFT